MSQQIDLAVAMSVDGERIATGDKAGLIRVLSLKRNALDARYKTEGDPVRSLAIRPDLIAAGSDTGAIRWWNTSTPEGADTFEQDRIASGELGRLVQGGSSAVTSLAFRPGSESLASGDAEGYFRLWDTSVPEPTSAYSHATSVVSIDQSSDGLVVTGDASGGVNVWNPREGSKLTKLSTSAEEDQGAEVTAVGIAKAARFIAAGLATGEIIVWSGLGDDRPARLAAHSAAVTRVQFSPDQETLYSAGVDGAVRAWRVPIERAQRILELARVPRAIDATSSGEYVAVSEGKNSFELIRVGDRRRLRFFQDRRGTQISDLTFVMGDKALISANSQGQLSVWSSRGSKKDEISPGIGAIEALAGAENLPFYAAGGSTGDVVIGDLRPALAEILSPEAPVTAMAISPDGSQAVLGLRNGDLVRANLGRRQAKAVAKTSPIGSQVACVAFHPDGRRVAAGYVNGRVALWDSTSGEVRPVTRRVSDEQIVAVGFDSSSDKIRALTTSGKMIRWSWGATVRGDGRTAATSSDGRVAASIKATGNGFSLMLDGVSSGPNRVTLASKPTALDAAADGSLVAAGTKEGDVFCIAPALGAFSRVDYRMDREVSAIAVAPRNQGGALVGLETGAVAQVAWPPAVVPLEGASSTASRAASVTPQGVAYLGAQAVEIATLAGDQKIETALNGSYDQIRLSADAQTVIAIRPSGAWAVWSSSSPDKVQTGAGSCRDACFLTPTRFATAHESGLIKLHTVGGNEGAELVGHSEPVSKLSASSDGARLASADPTGRVIVWDLSSQQALAETSVGGPLSTLAWSADGASVYAGASVSRTLLRWVPEQASSTPDELGADAAGFDGQMAVVSSDGKIASIATDGAVQLRSAEDGRLYASIPQADAIALAFAGGGQQLAILSRTSKLALIDASKPREQPGTGAKVTAAAWTSRGGGLFLTGGADGSLLAWPSTGGASRALAEGAGVVAIAPNPSEDTLFLATEDGLIRRLLLTGEQTAEASLREGKTLGLSLDSINKQLLVATTVATERFQIADLKRTENESEQDIQEDQPLRGIGKITNARQAALLDGGWTAAATRTGVRVWKPNGDPATQLAVSGQSLVGFAAARNRVVTVHQSGLCRVWNANSGEAISETSLKGQATGLRLAISADASSFALQRGGLVAVYNTNTCSPLRSLRSDQSIALCVLAGDRVATTSSDGSTVYSAGGAGEAVIQHDRPVTALAWLPDGNSIASSGADLTVRIAERSTGKETQRWKTNSIVRALAITEDGRLLFGGGEGGTIYRWDLQRGEASGSFETGANVHRLQYDAANDALIVVDENRAVSAWNPSSGKRVSQLASAADEAFISESGRLLCTDAMGVRLDQFTQSWSAEPYQRVQSADVTPNGLGILTAGGEKTALYSPFKVGDPIRYEVSDGLCNYAVISPDGREVAGLCSSAATTGRSYQLLLWNFADGVLLRSKKLDLEPVRCAFDPLGRQLAIVSADGRVQRYDLSKLELIETMRFTSPATGVVFDDQANAIITSHTDGSVRFSLPYVQRRQQLHEGGITSLDFSGDGAFLVTTGEDGKAVVWDIQSPEAQLVAELEGGSGTPIQARWSPQYGYLACCFRDAEHTTVVWESPKTRGVAIAPYAILNSPNPILSTAISNDEKSIATAAQDGRISLWSIDKKKVTAAFAGHTKAVVQVGFRNDGLLVSTDTGAKTNLWEQTASDNQKQLRAQKPKSSFSFQAMAEAVTGLVGNVSGKSKSDAPAEVRIRNLQQKFRTTTNAQQKKALRLQLAQARADLASGENGAASASPSAGTSVDDPDRRPKQNALQLQIEDVSDFAQKAEQARDSLRNGASGQEALLEYSEALQQFHDKINEFLQETSAAEELYSYSSAHKNELASFEFDNFYNATMYQAGGFKPTLLMIAESDDGGSVWVAAGWNQVTYQRTGAEKEEKIKRKGRLKVWDLAARAELRNWEDIDESGGRIRGMHFAPDGQSLFTIPDVFLFNIPSASSRRLGTATSWAVSPAGALPEQTLAIGGVTQLAQESQVLRMLGNQPLDLLPAGFKAYESIVTALAFANTKPYLAFAVRGPSDHRLFLANIADLKIQEVVKLEEVTHRQPWRDNKGKMLSTASRGVLSLSFLPNDDGLLSQTQYGKRKFQLKLWELNWSDPAVSEHKTSPSRLKPWFDASTPIRTVRGANRPLLIARRDNSYQIVEFDLTPTGEIEILKTPWGFAQHAFSSDNRWLAQGDASGNIWIWDTTTSEKIPLTVDGRQAHPGPIVGLAFAEVEPEIGVPVMLTSAGGEGRIKVWNTLSRLADRAPERDD